MTHLKWIACLFIGCLGALAQPIVTPTTVPTFTYLVNSGTFPVAKTVKVTLPSTSIVVPIVVINTQLVSPATVCPSLQSSCGWLSISPAQGNAPLTLSVSVNPTGLSPGNYSGSFVVDTMPSSGKLATTVAVNLQITNAAPHIVVSPAPGSLNWTASTPAGSIGTLSFGYTTGTDETTLIPSELDISSTGDIIPFNVTVANSKSGSASGTTPVWLRVSSTSPVQGYGIATSGSAFGGSLVPIYVQPDYTTLQGLGIGQYLATVTVTPATSDTKANAPTVVTVSLVVSAGAPTVVSVFPSSLTPAQAIDPVFTIYGTNFTANTSVFLDVFLGLANQISYQITTDRLKLDSPQILKAKVPTTDLPLVPAGGSYPYSCQFRIANGGFAQVAIPFTVTNPATPSIASIVNAASYQQKSAYAGPPPDPTPSNPSAVSPRGVISIFGQNLGPSTPFVAVTVACATGFCYPTRVTPTTQGAPAIQVAFTYFDPNQTPPKYVTQYAPILMVSSNQINAIVPWQVANVLQQTVAPFKTFTASVKVLSNSFSSNSYTAAVVPEDPGIFTFGGGQGQGQGAIINYDASGASTINSSTNKEPRGNVIAIFATGLGDLNTLSDGTIIPDGALTQASVATPLISSAGVQVFIGGQPAVVQWAGTSPGAVAGLVQINALVPNTSATGTVPVTLSITDYNNPLSIRTAQSGVTMGVK